MNPTLIKPLNGTRERIEEAEPINAPEVELTWDDLGKTKIKSLKVEGFARPVRYLSALPVDKVLELRSKHAAALKRGEQQGLTISILREVMVEPSLTTDASARAALKAHFALVNHIIEDVTTFKEVDDDLPKF